MPRVSMRRVPLQDVATVIMGQSPPSSAYNTEGEGLPFFQGKAEFGPLHPTPVKWCSAPTKVAESDDVLMSVRAPVGPTNLATERCCIGRGLAAIRAEPGVRSKWLLYAFRAMERSIDDLGTGTTFKAISGETLRQIEVPVACLEEQDDAIAEIEKQFSRLDEAVANLKRVKANLKRYKAAVLKAAVEGRLVPTEAEMAAHDGRGYETGSQLVARFLQERRRAWNGKRPYQDPEQPDARGLPPLPEGWAWTRLDTVAALKGGITVDKKRRDPTARPVPYLRVANVQRGYLDLEEVKEIEAPQADIEELRLQPGDILFNEGGDRDKLGRGWIWEGQLAECIHQNHVFRARPYSADVAGKLISWWGNTYGKDYFLREGKQTTNLASINMRKLSAFPVPIPPRLEQHRIVAEVDRRLSLAREVEVQVHANLARVQTSRHAMLVRAFGASMEPQQANVFMQVD